MGPCGATDIDSALEMDIEHHPPVGRIGCGKGRAADYAGVAYRDVEPAKCVERSLNYGPTPADIPADHAVVIRHRRTAGRTDLSHNGFGRAFLTGGIGQVVHHHPRPARGEHERVAPPHPAPRPGDQHDAAGEIKQCHVRSSSQQSGRLVCAALPVVALAESPARHCRGGSRTARVPTSVRNLTAAAGFSRAIRGSW